MTSGGDLRSPITLRVMEEDAKKAGGAFFHLIKCDVNTQHGRPEDDRKIYCNVLSFFQRRGADTALLIYKTSAANSKQLAWMLATASQCAGDVRLVQSRLSHIGYECYIILQRPTRSSYPLPALTGVHKTYRRAAENLQEACKDEVFEMMGLNVPLRVKTALRSFRPDISAPSASKANGHLGSIGQRLVDHTSPGSAAKAFHTIANQHKEMLERNAVETWDLSTQQDTLAHRLHALEIYIREVAIAETLEVLASRTTLLAYLPSWGQRVHHEVRRRVSARLSRLALPSRFRFEGGDLSLDTVSFSTGAPFPVSDYINIAMKIAFEILAYYYYSVL